MEDAAPSEEREVSVSTLELFFDLVFVFTLTQLTGLMAADAEVLVVAKVVLLLLGGMAGFLIMALAIPTTFADGGVAFGVGYLAVVALHSGLYMGGPELRSRRQAPSDATRGLAG